MGRCAGSSGDGGDAYGGSEGTLDSSGASRHLSCITLMETNMDVWLAPGPLLREASGFRGAERRSRRERPFGALESNPSQAPKCTRFRGCARPCPRHRRKHLKLAQGAFRLLADDSPIAHACGAGVDR